MKNKVIYAIMAILLMLIFIYTFSQTGTNDVAYVEEIKKERQQKDKDFKMNENISPIPTEQRASFQGLSYFEPDINYQVNATLEVLNEDSLLQMITTTGEKQKYVRYAYAHFEIDKQKLQLTIYKSMDRVSKGVLFLPFKDQTNGEETYSAGRYVEIKNNNGSSITIDFNKAYSPYCAYNETYSCPLPPKENHLNVKILAGERYSQK